MVSSELPQRRHARARCPALHGKHLVLIVGPECGLLSGGAIIGLIQGYADQVPIVCQADASVVELFQLPFNLFQTPAHL